MIGANKARAYFMPFDVSACARHIETKQLANRFYGQWYNLSDRIAQLALAEDWGSIEKIAAKADKIRNQFDDLLRGLSRCCYSG